MPVPARAILALFALTTLASTTSILAQQPVSAQQPPAPARPAPPRPTPAPRSITLDVVVTPKSGQPVAGLTQSDFTLFDNKSRRPITAFQAVNGSAPGAPANVILLVDAVNADLRTMAFEREQIEKYLRTDGGHLAHPISIAIFTDGGTQMQQNFSSDGNALADFLDSSIIGLRTIRDSSQFGNLDRLNLSLSTLQILVASIAPLPGRKLVLWVSPGWSYLIGTESTLTNKDQQGLFAEAVKLSTDMRNARITLYSVDPLGGSQDLGPQFYYEQFVKGIAKTNQIEVADLSLQVLAAQTGGLVLSDNNDVASLLARCMADTSAWYQITFDAAPADHPDDYHELQVKVDKPGLAARTRTGYYAQP